MRTHRFSVTLTFAPKRSSNRRNKIHCEFNNDNNDTNSKNQ